MYGECGHRRVFRTVRGKRRQKELPAGQHDGAGEHSARGLRTYGCIQDADAQREGINASARYPKNWVTTGDPAREFTMIQSAPLMLLADLMISCPYNWRNYGPSGPLFLCG